MSLPIRTTMADITALCGYLASKPIGATNSEAKAVLDGGVLDGRKVNAMKFWGLVEENEDTGKMKLTDLGRALTKNKFAHQAEHMRTVIKSVPAYMAIIERAVRTKEYTITTNEVAARWHKHFSADVSESEKVLNDQTVCFFQVAQGADLGILTIGRVGHPTRFEFAVGNITALIDGADPDVEVLDTKTHVEGRPAEENPASPVEPQHIAKVIELPVAHIPAGASNNRVFVAHGKNVKIANQVKEIISLMGFEPIVAMERETNAKPVPEKVMEHMRTCGTAIIHVAIDTVLFDKDGKEHPQINGNVLIEIGAAMGLYPGYKFILLVEEGLQLPSNLQGLYECRYSGDELSGVATMKLLKAIKSFKAAA